MSLEGRTLPQKRTANIEIKNKVDADREDENEPKVREASAVENEIQGLPAEEAEQKPYDQRRRTNLRRPSA